MSWLLELHSGLAQFVTSYQLDWICRQYWDESLRDRFVAWNDTEAAPECPFPYVVYRFGEEDIRTRSSGHSVYQKRLIRDVPLTLDVYAKQQPSGGSSAKAIAAVVGDEIAKHLGGHATERPQKMTLSHSNHLLTQYQNSFGSAMEDDCYQLTILYSLRIDSPIMA